MKKTVVILWFLIVILTLTAACTIPPDGAEETAAYETIAAMQTELAGSEGVEDPPPTATEAPPDDPTPTDTPAPPTDTPTITPTATEEAPCLRAGFLADVTVPDGSVFAPDTEFEKTWRLENTGSCTWNDNYDLVFDSGENMGGGAAVDLTIGNVQPGEVIDVTVKLRSPGAPGTYQGNWKLRSDDSHVFGVKDGVEPFFVLIEVVKAASFEILGAHHYLCEGNNYVSVEVVNTGSESLESSGGGIENLISGGSITYGVSNNTPFTENIGDCPPMKISDIEPGDTYLMPYDLEDSHDVYRITVILCTQDHGAGDCDTQLVEEIDIP